MVAKLQLDSTSHLPVVADKPLAAPGTSPPFAQGTPPLAKVPNTTQAIRIVDQKKPTEAPKVPGEAETTIAAEAKNEPAKPVHTTIPLWCIATKTAPPKVAQY